MAVDLAVALLALTASTVVRQLIEGDNPNTQDWAGVGAGVVQAIITHSGQGKKPDHGPALARIGRQFAAVPDREYRQHMAAGRRFLQDLPVDWRTANQRDRIIRDARGEFVRASAIASESGAVRQAALAEVAIAGCWLWVPSLPDVRRTLTEARLTVESALLELGGVRVARDYIDVLKLCRGFGAVPANWSIPVDLDREFQIAAALTVVLEAQKWAYCMGVWARAGSSSASSGGTAVSVEVRNDHWDEAEVWLGMQAMSPFSPDMSDIRVLGKGTTLKDTLWTPVWGRVAIKVRLPSYGHTGPLVAFLVPGASTYLVLPSW